MDVLGGCLGGGYCRYHRGGSHHCGQNMTAAAMGLFQVCNQLLYCLSSFICFC